MKTYKFGTLWGKVTEGSEPQVISLIFMSYIHSVVDSTLTSFLVGIGTIEGPGISLLLMILRETTFMTTTIELISAFVP